tara:strand:+ start:710 stop:1048 length:339 start_codon:yes stop_codon:yes gene_type:complete
MDIQGTIVSYTDQSGVSKAGKEYSKAELLIKNNDGYKDAEVHFCFTLFGKAMEHYSHSVGTIVNVLFNIESREYNGRWYTQLVAFKITRTMDNHLNEVQSKAAEQAGDDMPF